MWKIWLLPWKSDMSRSEQFAWPYRRLRQSPFGAESIWRISAGGGDLPVPVPVLWQGWDANSSATFHRSIRFDPLAVRLESGLADAPRVVFRIAVVAFTAGGRVKQPVWSQDVTGDGQQEFQISVELGLKQGSGLLGTGGLSTDLQLRTGVYLAESVSDAGVYAANRPGHVLFSDDTYISLDDNDTAVPMMAVSFKKGFLGITAPHADYYVGLEAIEDAFTSFRSSVVIYVNTDTGFDERLAEAQPEALADVYGGLALQLCMHLLLNGMLQEAESPYPTGTVGAVAEGFLAGAFPGRSFEALVQQLQVRPAEFVLRMRDLIARTSAGLSQ